MSGWSYPLNWYWDVTDTNHGVSVWQGTTGQFVVLANADYVAFLAAGNAATVAPTFAGLMSYIDGINQTYTSSSYLPVSSGVNYSIVNTPPLIFDFTPTAGGLTVTLPQMNLFGSLAEGRPLLIHNAGSFSFALNQFGGSLVDTIQVGGFLEIYLNSNTTQAGTLTQVRLLRSSRATNGNSDGTFTFNGFPLIQAAVTTAALTAPRTWTLPAANSNFGATFFLAADEIGGVTSINTLSVARAGADTINGGAGSIVLNRARDFVLLETDGSSNWTIVGGKGSLASTDLSDVVVAGSWTPSDASGAGLTFSAVNVAYDQTGNEVRVYGRVTYPATASGANASIGSLPVAVPNVLRATNPNPVSISSAPAGVGAVQAITILGSSRFDFFAATGGTAITNAQLSGATVVFNISYPAA